MSTFADDSQQSPTPRKSKKPRRRGRLVAGVVVALVVLALVAGIWFTKSSTKPRVTTARATVQTLTAGIKAPGSVDSTTSTPVYSPAAGTLASVAVVDGQQVKAGDLLATLDDSAQQTALAQARAAAAQADAQVTAAHAQASTANAQLAAARAMPDGTSAQADARRAAIKAANAAQESADAAAEAAAASRQAAAVGVRAAEANAAKTEIKAPVGGYVTFDTITITSLDGTGPKAAPGAAVTTAGPLFTITDLAQLAFIAQVDEADIAAVPTDAKATVTLDAFPTRTFTGQVREIAPKSTTTKTGGVAYLVKIPLTVGDAALRPGMSGDVEVATADVPDALVVPAQAVQTDGTGKYVFTIVDGTAHRVEVTIGVSTDTWAQIRTGLHPGDTVVTSQFTAIKDGSKVDVGA